MARPESQGIDVTPGLETHIAVRLTQVERLQYPYRSNCTKDFPSDYADFAPMNNVYSEENCLVACRRMRIYDACECYESFDIERYADRDATLATTNVPQLCKDVRNC